MVNAADGSIGRIPSVDEDAGGSHFRRRPVTRGGCALQEPKAPLFDKQSCSSTGAYSRATAVLTTHGPHGDTAMFITCSQCQGFAMCNSITSFDVFTSHSRYFSALRLQQQHSCPQPHSEAFHCQHLSILQTSRKPS